MSSEDTDTVHRNYINIGKIAGKRQVWLLGPSLLQAVCKPHFCGRVSRDSMKKVQMLTVPKTHTKQKAQRHPSE